MATLAQAISKSLLANLSGAAAQKFNVNETEFKEFLQGFLTSQLTKSKSRAPRVDAEGKRLPGRVSGYLLFSNENRDGVKKAHPELKFTDIGKELGRMWGELSDSQKADWNQRATAANAANGVTPTPAPSKARATAATSSKTAPAASAAKGKAPAAKTVAGGKVAASAPAAKKPVAKKPVAKATKRSADDSEDEE